MSKRRRNWTRDELIMAFNLYCRIPFGKLHHRNPEIIKLSEVIGRTPSAIAMKLVNFASFDPKHKKRNISGLSHASKGDRNIFEEFSQDWENLAFLSEKMLVEIGYKSIEEKDKKLHLYKDILKTEVTRNVKTRVVQSFFRDAVLASYNFSCAMCSLSIPSMLNASHIIPWSRSKERRVDPCNGLSLCVLHDRAFDRGLITIDECYRVILSKEFKQKGKSQIFEVGFSNISGKKIKMPERFYPDQNALIYHRNNIFRN